MTNQNQISVEIPQTVIDSVTEKLQECKAALAPYLQGLTLAERMSLFKMGNKTVTTVQKVKSYMETNPEFIPAYMNPSEFLKDEKLVTQLNPIVNLATQLAVDAEDTIMLAGSEAIQSALLYYGTVREAHAKGVVTAKPVYDDLSQRFSRRNRPAQ
jgi:hypothetical protein